MADISVAHTLAAPAGTIDFNVPDADGDQFYLGPVPGLSGVPLRRVVYKFAYADGAYSPPAFHDARYFQPTGTFLITRPIPMADKQEKRNTMEAALTAAYESMVDTAGTWTWTPAGGTPLSLTVIRDAAPIEYEYVDNYLNLDFTFSLIALDPFAVDPGP